MTLELYTSGSTAAGSQPTIAGGLRERSSRLSVIFVSGALAISGTSSAEPKRLWDTPYSRVADSTASTHGWGVPQMDAADLNGPVEEARRAISELRRISGLTWEQLGELFGVSRRSVHFWASGKPMNAANEERLLHVLAIMRKADRGDARLMRMALFDASSGIRPFDLLVAQRFDEASAMLGDGAGRRTMPRVELSSAAEKARKPLPPEELAGAMHDRVHQDTGRGRAAQTVKVRKHDRGR